LLIAPSPGPLFANSRAGDLPDHTIRPHQHIGGDRQADLFGGFQIYHKFELHGLLDWQVLRFRAFENLVVEDSGARNWARPKRIAHRSDGRNKIVFLACYAYYTINLWLSKLIVESFIEEKIWDKHRVTRSEIEEALAHRRAIRLRHRQHPVRVVVISATLAGRMVKIILQFQGKGRYFLVTAMDLTAKERKQYGKKVAGYS